MEYTNLMDLLDFNKPNVGHVDLEGNAVCGCCRSYYVVGREELASIKDTVFDLYEANRVAIAWLKEYCERRNVKPRKHAVLVLLQMASAKARSK